jgi:hypothetical protein
MVCWWLLVHSHKHKKATKLIIAEIPNQAALMYYYYYYYWFHAECDDATTIER